MSQSAVAARARGKETSIVAELDGFDQPRFELHFGLRDNINPRRIGSAGEDLPRLSNREVICPVFAYTGTQKEGLDLFSAGPRDLDIDPLQDALGPGPIDLPTPLLREGRETRQFSGLIGQILTNIESARTRAIVYAQEQGSPEQKAALEAQALARADSLRRIQEGLSRVLGREVRFKFDLQHQAPRILFDGDEIPVTLLGEGLQRTFSWLLDLLVRLDLIQWKEATRSPLDQEFLLFLDEVDQSLHPQMQMRLMPALRGLFPRARIYATTHSPFVVASVEDGYVFPIRPDPKTHRISGLIDPQRLSGGRSLEAVVAEVFDAPSTFID
jgi:hypothetical protein